MASSTFKVNRAYIQRARPLFVLWPAVSMQAFQLLFWSIYCVLPTDVAYFCRIARPRLRRLAAEFCNCRSSRLLRPKWCHTTGLRLTRAGVRQKSCVGYRSQSNLLNNRPIVVLLLLRNQTALSLLCCNKTRFDVFERVKHNVGIFSFCGCRACSPLSRCRSSNKSSITNYFPPCWPNYERCRSKYPT